MKNTEIKTRILQLISDRYQVVSVLLAVALSVFIYMQINQDTHNPFPEIASGVYIGKIVDVDAPLYFQLQSAPNHSPTVNVYDSGSGISVSWSAGKPMLLKSEDAFLRMTAAKECAGYSYCGQVTNLSNGKQGKWYLNPEIIEPEQEDQKSILLRHISLISKKIKSEEARIYLENMKNESRKLAAALEDAESIRNKSDTRFSSQQLRISELKEQIQSEETSLRLLQSNFETAKSVAPRGRVTSLARQILSKEFELLTPSGIDNDKLDLLEKARQAREVLSLKQQMESLE